MHLVRVVATKWCNLESLPEGYRADLRAELIALDEHHLRERYRHSNRRYREPRSYTCFQLVE